MNELYNLTNAQRQIYVMASYAGDDTTSISVAFEIEEVFNSEALEDAVNELIRRNDALQIRIVNDNGNIKQHMATLQKYEIIIELFDSQDTFDEWLKEISAHGLDIHGELYQIIGYRVGDKFGVYLKLHHIICDGWGMYIVCKELSEIYKACIYGKTVTSEPSSYLEYIAREASYDSSRKFERDKNFWETVYHNRTSLVSLSSRPAISNLARRIEYYMDSESVSGIQRYCKKQNCSVYELFATALGCYMESFTEEKSFMIGTTFIDRPNNKDTVGMFVNSVPLLLHVDRKDFDYSIKMTKKAIYDAFKHQKYNYTCMANDFRAVNLFDVKLNYQIATKVGGDYYKKTNWIFQQAQSEGLIINIMDEMDGSIKIAYDHLVCQYREEEIMLLHQHICHIIGDGLEGKNEVDYMSEEEKNQILFSFNNTEREYPAGKSVIDLFEEQVERTPDQTAAIFGECQLSYAQVNERINALAHRLLERGVGPGEFVAILAERSIEMMIGIYAVLKAGGAYIPIDPTYPEDRIKYIIEDCQTKLILTYGAKIPTSVAVLSLEQMDLGGDYSNPVRTSNTEDLAYCIYTSGTTGKPKGVMLTHNNLVNYINYAIHSYLKNSKVIPLFTNYGFDLTVTSIFGAWLSGSALDICGLDDEKNIRKIFEGTQYTFAKMTPSHLRIAALEAENKYSQLNSLVIGGEELDVITSNAILHKFGDQISIHNEYGPTETTVGCCDYIYDPKDVISSTVLIGKPIHNTRIYIMNDMKLCGMGVPGELCVTGAGVAKGYLNRPELTAQKFIPNPYGQGRMYRTGDLARWLPDGNLEYLGRIDEQVKIRGFRIELGEVESVIRENAIISDCTMVAKSEENGDKVLCAYLVSDQVIDRTELKSYLVDKLPAYMVPSRMIQIDKIPMTANGKVDRMKLPEIQMDSTGDYIAPETESERFVSEVFCEILGVQQAGKKDEFFELGGHSLRATRMLNQIEAKTGCRFSIKDIFAKPTVEGIAELIDSRSQDAYQEIPIAVEKPYYPMSSAQKRVYLICQMHENGVAYNMPFALRLTGDVEADAMKKAMQQVVDRHEILRTEFTMIAEEPVQRVWDKVKADFTYVEEEGSDEKLIHDFISPFDFTSASLLRMKLINREAYHLLLVDMHHIVGDGMSLGNFIREWTGYYNGVQPESAARQYKDYSEWMRCRELSRQKEYWVKEFSDEIPVLNMTLDYNRPQNRSYQGALVKKELTSSVYRAIGKLAEETGTTTYMVLLSAAMVLLGKYSRQEEIIIGTPIGGRVHRDTENMLGMFVNTLAMRGKPEEAKSYGEFLTEIKESCLRAYENQEYPFEELLEALEIKRDLSHNPLFDVMLVLQNNEEEKLVFRDAKTEIIRAETKVAKCDLTFNIYQENNAYKIELEYCTELFKKFSAEQILEHYVAVLQQVSGNSSMKIRDVAVITEAEHDKILKDFNATRLTFPEEKTMIELFEEQVEKTPERVAVEYKDSQLTYQQLNGKINHMAKRLREKGIVPGDYVAIMAERSIEMIVGIYGIIKAGAAYVPIDSTYPKERVEYMLKDCQPKLMLTYHTTADANVPEMKMEDCLAWEAEDNPEQVNQPDDVAYCIYTSGTTGNPKGVMVAHTGISNLKVYFEEIYEVQPADRVLQFAKSIFDASVWEMNMALLNGAALVIPSEQTIYDVDSFAQWFCQNEISIATLPPNYFLQIGEIKPRLLITAGSETNWKVIEKAGSSKYINAYGPTETTICATDWNFKKGSTKEISIGKPISNTKIYIMNGMELCGVGVPGELCVTGAGLTKGYLNRPELTAEKFIKNPFGKGTLYRTGDLARWLSDGNIEYLGRIDEQVKIRGFRIELGEVDNAIRENTGIRDCSVMAFKEDNGEKVLCAYLVADQIIDLAYLKNHLQEKLPAYMVPTRMMQIDKIPMTINGKVDLKKLPKIDVGSMEVYIEPETDSERLVSEMFCEILGIESAGKKDNFFELGGHSLRATRMVNRIEAKTGGRLSIKDIFAKPTVEGIAELIDARDQDTYQEIPKAEGKYYYPMSSAQKRVYLICQIDETGVTYNMPFALRLRGDVDAQAMRNAMQQVINRHEILRTEFTMIDGEPVQRIWEEVAADFTYVEENEEDSALIDAFIQPFDFASASLLRMKLIKRKMDYVLLADMHHIVGDGMSIGNFIREWAGYYNGVQPEEAARQYKDYSEWMNGRDLSEQKGYWVKEFSDEIPVLNMPLDDKRPQTQSYAGALVKMNLDANLYHAVEKLAEETGTTEYMVFLSAIMVLLGKYSRQEDIVIGTPISGRTHRDTEDMLGMFINTLAMRGRPEETKQYENFLGEIKEVCLKAYEHQEYPFEELVEVLNLERDMSRNPLFDVMFVLQNNEEEKLLFHSAKTEIIRAETKVSKCDLTFNVYQEQKSYKVELEYCTDLFKKSSAERMLEHYHVVLQQLVENRKIMLKDVEVITEDERVNILKDFNDTRVAFPSDKTMIDFFEAEVERAPEKIAVVYKDAKISYWELNGKINHLAKELRNRGVGPGDYVAIMAERSIEMIIGIYGIIKAGGAYVPIDPTYPRDRVEYILEDCNPKVLLTYRATAETAVPVMKLEGSMAWKGEGNLLHVNRVDDVAYCIYTSGTTGKPKGAMIKHISLVNRILWMQSMYPLGEEDVILQKTTFSFDVSVWEIVWWGFFGARAVMLEQEVEKNPEEICDVIEKEKVTVLHFVPSMLNSFLAYIKNRNERVGSLGSLRRVFASGEALNKETVDTFNKILYQKNKTCLSNLYGPTEACIDVTYFECSPCQEKNLIPIGKPISNIQIYILNGMKLCGIGVPGELCIAGIGVAKGYLNKEELTKDKFVDNPYDEGKMYRTGDLACWRGNGDIAYLGRMDSQVKIRGLRIELGEIENSIRKLDYISDCAVVDKLDQNGDKVIYGYFVSDKEIPIHDVINELKMTLPVYMVPSRMQQIDAIPVTSNGKLNRKMLPDIKMTSNKRHVEAVDEKDAKLYEICKTILNVEEYGQSDNFIAMGGDSLKALKIASMMNEAGYEVSTKEVLVQLLQNI
ncbi:non-ribosomal peptide synthetase [Paenibacillus wynnii]|uniref:non-ribosomal peptide synthetase n=1 Tax=Paenibacillus wynnii TaxID=268407 RepID=UPI0006921E58|nr:non-ribosomal peptide synthetase [Paenibacillus wynnii]